MSGPSPSDVLKMFDEQVNEFLSSSFFTKVRGAGAIVEFKQNEGWESIFVGPDEESIKALVLTLRLFMQNNDRISLQNMRSMYATLQVPSQLVTDFSDWCKDLNDFLDSQTNLSIEEHRQLTYRDILIIFVYGTYAHVDECQRQKFDRIRTTPFFPMFQDCLIKAMLAFRQCLRALSEINQAALPHLQ